MSTFYEWSFIWHDNVTVLNKNVILYSPNWMIRYTFSLKKVIMNLLSWSLLFLLSNQSIKTTLEMFAIEGHDLVDLLILWLLPIQTRQNNVKVAIQFCSTKSIQEVCSFCFHVKRWFFIELFYMALFMSTWNADVDVVVLQSGLIS